MTGRILTEGVLRVLADAQGHGTGGGSRQEDQGHHGEGRQTLQALFLYVPLQVQSRPGLIGT